MTCDLAWRITEAIANSEGVEPAELDIILAKHINIDAVNKLLNNQNSTWTLTFELPEKNVTVTSEGTILVDGNQENSWVIA